MLKLAHYHSPSSSSVSTCCMLGLDGEASILSILTLNQRRRLLISQDRHEIYITIAEYDTEYENYICDRVPSEETQQPYLPPRPDESPLPPTPTPKSRKPGASLPLRTLGAKQDRAAARKGDALTAAPKPDDDATYPQHSAPVQPQPSSKRPEAGFIKMRCFGPYNVSNAGDMKAFCPTIVALTLQAIGEIQVATPDAGASSSA